MQEILKKTCSLTASDIDCHGWLRLSSLLGYLQDIAVEHSIILGIDPTRIAQEFNVVWLMTRLHLTLERPIPFPGELTIQTYHRGVTKSAMIYRDFDIFQEGERIGEATNSWVLVDLQKRKIVRPDSISAMAACPRPAIVKDRIPEKIKSPEDMKKAFTRPIYYSDTGISGHVNNTKYAVIACDVIGYDKRKGQFFREVQINYLQECFPGDEIITFRGRADGVDYVRGTDASGAARFEVSLRFEDD